MKKIPYTISFIAHSGTGKTTLLEKVIPLLKSRGYTLGVLKHDAHRFDIDHKGKDSYRFTQAGADTMILSSDEKTAMVKKHGQSPDVLNLIEAYMSDVDIVLTEGFKGSELPKIEVYRSSLGRELLSRESNYDETLVALASDSPMDIDVPLLSIDDAEAVADFIESQYKEYNK
jgi:molybdopterin-guanine dinucleotide biosynthesis protein MobB